MPRSRPTTPVRRVSRGSISSQHRASLSSSVGPSNINNSESTPLNFLSHAIDDLSFETATLQSNLEAINEIHSALDTFNESFSMLLYGLKMNAFCVEWPEAPGEEQFRDGKIFNRESIQRRDESLASITGLEDLTVMATGTNPISVVDQTYMTQDDDLDVLALTNRKVSNSSQQSQQQQPLLKSAMKKSTTSSLGLSSSSKTITKPKITIAERKKREQISEQIIDQLPLEYRGNDPSQKQLAMKVVMGLIASGQSGLRIQEFISNSNLPQAKVNKCLIALVNSKQVFRKSENGVVYRLDCEKYPIAR